MRCLFAMKSQRELSAYLCVCLRSQFVVKVSKVLNMLTELTSGRNKTNVDKLKLYSQRQLLRHTPGPNQGYRTAPVTDRGLHIYCINAIFIKAFTIKGETCNGHRTINVQLQGTAVSLTVNLSRLLSEVCVLCLLILSVVFTQRAAQVRILQKKLQNRRKKKLAGNTSTRSGLSLETGGGCPLHLYPVVQVRVSDRLIWERSTRFGCIREQFGNSRYSLRV